MIEPVAWCISLKRTGFAATDDERNTGIWKLAGYPVIPLYSADALAAAREEGRLEGLEAAAKACEWAPDGSGHFGNLAAAIRALRGASAK